MIRRLDALRTVSGVIIACALTVSCARPQAANGPTPDPEPFGLVSALIVPKPIGPSTARFGGISGLAFDRVRGDWIAVSDDHEAPRWYVCRFDDRGQRLRLASATRVSVSAPPARDVPRVLDFEAVAVLPDGDLLVASEGILRAGRRLPASILRYHRDGRYVDEIPIPARYLPSERDGVQRGLRDNHGFEGLAIALDGARLWAVAESPLLQDDNLPTAEHGARSRVIEFEASGGSYRPVRELVYPIDRAAIPSWLGKSVEIVDQGVSELTMLPDGTLLSLERAFVRDGMRRSANVIRIFALDLTGADDVSAVESLRDAPGARPIHKVLVRDMMTLTAGLPPALATLENFEAMAPGPRLPLGSSLLLMTDDNFSPRQVTAAVLLNTGGR